MKSTITTVALDSLVRSPLNVRETKPSDPAIGQLAASILAKGLISPIAVHAVKKPKGKFGVLAGDRRWQAIRLLAEQKADFDFDAIPANLLEGDDAELTEVSLAENYVRQGMRPPEIYAAFRAIRERNPKITDAELAEHYGLDKARVARIMRLAYLHPTVFEAYAAGQLQDEEAFAYAATADQALQLQTFQTLSKKHEWDRRPSNIRAAMKVGDQEEGRLLKFIGAKAYRSAGGGIEPNLFADKAGEGRVMDPQLLRRLVNEKLEVTRTEIVDRYGAFGEISFVDEPPTDKYGWSGDLRINVRPGKPEAGQEARLEEISKRRVAIVNELRHDALYDRRGAPRPEHKEKVEGLGAEEKALQREAAEIRASIPGTLPKGAKLAVIRIDQDGKPDVSFYWEKKPAAAKAESGPRVKSAAELERARWGLTKDAMQAMLLLRREMLREQLVATAESGIAADFIVYTFARAVLRPSGTDWKGQPILKGAALGIETPGNFGSPYGAPPASIDKLFRTLTGGEGWAHHKRLLAESDWVRAEDPIEGWTLFQLASALQKAAASAVAAGQIILATTGFQSEGRTPRLIDELANTLEAQPDHLPWADTFVADEAFFALIGHKQRLELLREWGLVEHAKVLKKAESAAFCARVIRAARDDDIDCAKLGIDPDDRGEIALWRPEWLDTHVIEPLPAAEKAPEEVEEDLQEAAE